VDEFELAVGSSFDGRLGVVDEGVVASAEEDQVADVGWSEVSNPFVYVMDVAPLGFAPAAGELAVAVSYGDGAALGGGGVAL
jgi:hypothetical protein